MPNERTIPRICSSCGTNFWAWRSSKQAPSHGQFCGRTCADAAKTAAVWTRFSEALNTMKDIEGCWASPVGFPNADGYVRIGSHKNRVFAHKAAWILADGTPIPSGGKILHVCDNPPCVRNDDEGVYILNGIAYERRGHLWLGNTHANMLDKVAKGRWRGGRPKKQACHVA